MPVISLSHIRHHQPWTPPSKLGGKVFPGWFIPDHWKYISSSALESYTDWLTTSSFSSIPVCFRILLFTYYTRFIFKWSPSQNKATNTFFIIYNVLAQAIHISVSSLPSYHQCEGHEVVSQVNRVAQERIKVDPLSVSIINLSFIRTNDSLYTYSASSPSDYGFSLPLRAIL